MQVTLTELHPEEQETCGKLRVLPSQRTFVRSNYYSMREARRLSTISVQMRMIRLDGHPVGFLMFRYLAPVYANRHGYAHKACYEITRIMVDSKFQRRGIGRAALVQVIDHLRTRPMGPAARVYLSYHPDNIVAKDLYQSFGFQETSVRNQMGEVVAFLKLDQ